MSNEPNAKAVGLFIVIGFAIFFGLVAKFTWSKIMPQKDDMVVMYFQESVKGLNVGSPVVLEGVEVGKVVQIELVANPNTMDFSIPVYVRFSKVRDDSDTTFVGLIEKKKMLEDLIHRGLRARLATQSYLTGQLMIELAMLPDTPIVLKNTKAAKTVFEIPTSLSTIGELSKGFQDLPLKEMVDRMNRILSTMETQLPIVLPQFAELGKSMNELAVTLNKSAANADRVIPKTNQTLNHVNQTLDDISGAAKSMRNLSDYLERHPEALLRGKGY